MKVSILTLGCKVNQSESFGIASILEGMGYNVSCKLDFSDIYIINTCAVTKRADYDSKALIRRALKINPNAKIYVTGCFSHIFPKKAKEAGRIDFIFKNEAKHLIPEYVGKISKETKIVEGSKTFWPDPKTSLGRTRAFLKIQDGCNRFCTYCIIPYARGRPKSLKKEEVIRKILSLYERGFKEVVLSGINLSDYGKDNGENLLMLMRSLKDLKDSPMIRFGSIFPQIVNGEFCDLISSEPFCRHIHISAQSFSNKVLQAMGRNYTCFDLIKAIEKIYLRDKRFSIGLDIIVGFPQEDEKGFLETYCALRDLPISYIHIFPFSKREGTKAYKMKEIPKGVVKERLLALKEINETKRKEFREKNLGKLSFVIFEKEVGDGLFRGLSDNYIRFYVKHDKNICGSALFVLGEKLTHDGIGGSVVEGEKNYR